VNYRHQFHAGNFADVFKHALLADLLRLLQRKEKGILYLDTHAGRGMYHLATAATGDRLERRPEHPEGWGRIASATLSAPLLRRYRDAVRVAAGWDAGLYPGSPAIVGALLRPQDRMHLCERHPEDHAALDARFGGRPRLAVSGADGFTSVRAVLPNPERRALILIDPPFEAQDEYEQIDRAVSDALRRLPSATIVIWHPLSERADANPFTDFIRREWTVPTAWARLEVASARSAIKMRGCGLILANPPWGFEPEWREALPEIASRLALEGTGHASLDWLVPER
jgi:23S rRNA (adenine2030-N6)-methyltransferase